MAYYQGNTRGKIFRGSSCSLNRYLGKTKMAGWKYMEQIGKNLTVWNTYNDSAFVRINGKTIEVGTGDKSPDNLYSLQSTNNFDLICKSDVNMIPYDPSTWGEWSKITPSGIISDNTGITLTADGTHWIEIRIYNMGNPATKYGLLYNVVSCTLTGNATLSMLLSGVLDKTIGNQKLIKVSPSSLPYNYLNLYIDTTSAAGEYIKLKDFRLYELPAGSSIEYDFTNLTADVLNSKYPFVAKDGIITFALHFPHALRSLPDGTKDYIEIDDVAKTARLVQNVGTRTLPTTSRWNDWNVNYKRILDAPADKMSGLNTLGFCNVAKVNNNGVGGLNTIGVISGDKYAYWYPDYSKFGLNGSETVVEASAVLQNWLSTNTIIYTYKLATPVITMLDYAAVQTYYKHTNVYTTAATQPELSLKCKVTEI